VYDALLLVLFVLWLSSVVKKRKRFQLPKTLTWREIVDGARRKR
jgi:hypothetical protein